MTNCIDCLNMVTRIDKKIAWCKIGHSFNYGRDCDIFDLTKQLKRFGYITGFISWKLDGCEDFVDNSPYPKKKT
jgi:hypothetical protein